MSRAERARHCRELRPRHTRRHSGGSRRRSPCGAVPAAAARLGLRRARRHRRRRARMGRADRACADVAGVCSSPRRSASAQRCSPSRRRVPGSGWPQPVVGAACGLATLFWIAFGTPAVLLNWQPRSAIARCACGTDRADRRVRRRRRVAGALAVARAGRDGDRLDRRHRCVSSPAARFGRHKLAPRSVRANRGKASAAASPPSPSMRCCSCRSRRAPASTRRSNASSVALWIAFADRAGRAVDRRRSASSRC